MELLLACVILYYEDLMSAKEYEERLRQPPIP